MEFRQWNDRALDHATAHEGAVTAVLPTEDGNHWITAGTDSRIRLWDSHNLRCAARDLGEGMICSVPGMSFCQRVYAEIFLQEPSDQLSAVN